MTLVFSIAFIRGFKGNSQFGVIVLVIFCSFLNVTLITMCDFQSIKVPKDTICARFFVILNTSFRRSKVCTIMLVFYLSSCSIKV